MVTLLRNHRIHRKQMDINKIIYWIATLVMCLVFAFSAGMYITKYDMIVQHFPGLGFPGWLVGPLAVLKILGIITVLSNQSKILKEWAYAGFFFDAVLAFGAHHYAGDGQGAMSTVAIVAILISRYFDWKIGR